MAETSSRPDPDQLLAQLKEEETSEKKRGYLKVFLGYAAGVGKTYRMLSEGQLLKSKGEDVLIGLVETHGRAETNALTRGLEQMPRITIPHHGIQLHEFDLDEALKRKPSIILLDELAHTNAEGMRHTKRYLDVEELLNQGISVYTTLNIQHIESVHDVVSQITGIKVFETVPDSLLDKADKIELVDLPPEELLQRFRDGKVYVPEKARTAIQKFFRKGNLLALRELALRYTARHVDTAMLSYKKLRGIRNTWVVGSRLIVCVSPSPLSEHPIRVAHRLAEDLRAEWYAVYVESLRQGTLNKNQQLQLDKNLQLAQDLGAEVIRTSGTSPADEIVSFARSKNATLIIVGYSGQNRLQQLFKGSLLNSLIQKCSPIQLLMVGNPQEAAKPIVSKVEKTIKHPQVKGPLIAVSTIALSTLAMKLLHPYLDITNTALLYMVPIVASSYLSGLSGGILASICAVLCLNFFFIPPIFTFNVSDFSYLPTFFVLLFVGISTSLLSDIVRKQNLATRRREKYLSLLYEFSRDLFYSIGFIELLERSTLDLATLFNCEAVILIPDSSGHLSIRARAGDSLSLGEHEIGIASWVMQHGKAAGRNTDTLSSSHFKFIPLLGKKGSLGVLAIGRPLSQSFLNLEEEFQLESFISIIALAMENAIQASSAYKH
jgi:two-component system sensor histidine kinase KdpD